MFPSSQSQNLYHLLVSRELGASVSLEGIRDRHLIKNVNEDNYTKTNFYGHNSEINGLEVKGYLAATVCWEESIKLWNLETGQCRWTFKFLPNEFWFGNLEILENHVVCETCPGSTDDHNNMTIRIIDIKTGVETASITINRLKMSSHICTMARQIFCLLSNGNIGEWSLEGKFVREIKCEKFPRVTSLEFLRIGDSKLLNLGNFLVHYAENTILIYNLKENITKKIEFKIGELKHLISSVHLASNSLFLGFQSQSENQLPMSAVINLKSFEINHYQPPQESDQEINSYSISDSSEIENPWIFRDSVSQIIAHKGWIYLGHVSGKLIAVNTAENKQIFFGKHISPVYHLAIQDQILISGSVRGDNSILKFWNIKTLTNIGMVETPGLAQICFVYGKILACVEEDLIQWDYLVPHKRTR